MAKITSGSLIDEELFPSPSVYHCLCSLNRHYFFFVLRCLSLQTSGFPLKSGGSSTTFWMSRRDSTSSNTVVGSLLLVLSFGFCTFTCGVLVGILYLHVHKDYTSTSFVPFSSTLFVQHSGRGESDWTGLHSYTLASHRHSHLSSVFGDLHDSSTSHDVMSCA